MIVVLQQRKPQQNRRLRKESRSNSMALGELGEVSSLGGGVRVGTIIVWGFFRFGL